MNSCEETLRDMANDYEYYDQLYHTTISYLVSEEKDWNDDLKKEYEKWNVEIKEAHYKPKEKIIRTTLVNDQHDLDAFMNASIEF